MGNCAPKIKKPQTPSVVYLSGPNASLDTTTCLLLHIALLHKQVTIVTVQSTDTTIPTLRCGHETVTFSNISSALAHTDRNFQGPKVLDNNSVVKFEDPTAVMRTVVLLQHGSLVRHIEKMVEWTDEMVGKENPRVEMERLGRRYSQVQEILLEHARMEERIVFPIMEKADKDLCATANEQHGRDLPMMNGIKEDIKSMIVLDYSNPNYQEAVLNLSHRLKTLSRNCREHFEEEERVLLPMLDFALKSAQGRRGGGNLTDDGVMMLFDQVMEVMEGTHSHLFHVLMAGLLPHESMKYLHLVRECCRDKDRVTVMFRTLVEVMERRRTTTTSSPLLCNFFENNHVAVKN